MTALDWHAGRSDLPAIALLDAAPADDGIDHVAVRRHRQQRVRTEMAKRDIAALVLCDPVNIRYATGTRNMQVFTARNAPARYLILTESWAILYEFKGCEHLAAGFETVDEVRPALTATYVAAGPALAEREQAWAAEVANTLIELVGPRATIGIERFNAGAALALGRSGLRIVDAQEPVEHARAIKSAEEVKCVRAAVRTTEVGVGRLRAAIRPGITEAALWSVLHQAVIAQGADYIETRLLNAGPRTNPWFQETGTRVIQPNELIALDTDVVGVHGYYADFSRTFHAGPDRPTAVQRELYKAAHAQVHHNMALLKPGLGFREFAEKAWPIPERYQANRYFVSVHGCGMTGEYPYLYHGADFAAAGYDGVVAPGMVLCAESYIGEQGGTEGVKLEQQVLVTDTGIEVLSTFPFEDDLLA